jgi:hypothetical protein
MMWLIGNGHWFFFAAALAAISLSLWSRTWRSPHADAWEEHCKSWQGLVIVAIQSDRYEEAERLANLRNNALRVLKSHDRKSAENLRIMFDAEIAEAIVKRELT